MKYKIGTTFKLKDPSNLKGENVSVDPNGNMSIGGRLVLEKEAFNAEFIWAGLYGDNKFFSNYKIPSEFVVAINAGIKEYEGLIFEIPTALMECTGRIINIKSIPAIALGDVLQSLTLTDPGFLVSHRLRSNRSKKDGLQFIKDMRKNTPALKFIDCASGYLEALLRLSYKPLLYKTDNKVHVSYTKFLCECRHVMRLKDVAVMASEQATNLNSSGKKPTFSFSCPTCGIKYIIKPKNELVIIERVADGQEIKETRVVNRVDEY